MIGDSGWWGGTPQDVEDLKGIAASATARAALSDREASFLQLRGGRLYQVAPLCRPAGPPAHLLPSILRCCSGAAARSRKGRAIAPRKAAWSCLAATCDLVALVVPRDN